MIRVNRVNGTALSDVSVMRRRVPSLFIFRKNNTLYCKCKHFSEKCGIMRYRQSRGSCQSAQHTPGLVNE